MPPTQYRADIDGLRALAVVLVVVFHAFPKTLSGGFVGVDVFFVISGYLITGIIREQKARGTFSLAHIYERVLDVMRSIQKQEIVPEPAPSDRETELDSRTED